MSIAAYLKEIGRGKDGARALTREQAADLMSRLLDGEVSDLERGAFAIAMRIKGESPEELAGFMDAVVPRTLTVAWDGPAVVLPSYNGARRLPNLTPLLAALLAREGIATLVHGFTEDPVRVTSAAVFSAMGLPAVDSACAAQGRWSQGQPAFMSLRTLNPGLAALLDIRAVLGLRNPGHTLAKLLPAIPGAVRVVNHTHPEYSASLAGYLQLSGARALLLRGTEGEPVADARRLPALRSFLDGADRGDLAVPAQTGPLAELPALPAQIDAETTAGYTAAVLAGERPVPAPILRQVQALVALTRAH